MKGLGWSAAVVAGLAGATAFGHGGPREAWAVVRLDGWYAIPYLPPDWSTCYPPSFTQYGFLGIQPGDSHATVRAALGEPFGITWSEDNWKGASVTFERSNGRWVAVSAHGVEVPPGTSIESLEGRRAGLDEWWYYSRSCTSEQSERVRAFKLRGGRVVRRSTAVIFD